ncbi:amino acid transporter [Sanghuangporus baumii]|uniref:Amino acid transporter n=1 Tax=Sanghuangporus baumii TaxID=108892 RepID=A0A9Q5HRJ3_SANBA|nr:amino acid transporter [Sanghuangporus baumii]
MLNLGEMLGSGIFSIPGIVMKSLGSVGMFMLAWILAPIFTFAGLSAYTELASMFPNRSGAEVVYLEQAYPRPRSLVPVSFAVTTVLLSFSATNSIVFAQYFMAFFELPQTGGRQTILALSMVTVALSSCTGCFYEVVVKSNECPDFCEDFGAAIVSFVVVSGIAVLSGLTRIKDPWSNFSDPWSGATFNGNSIATAFVKTHFAFVGWNNAFNVLAEVKGRDPVRTVRNAGRISLSLVSLLFLLTNIAYIATIPKEEIRRSGQLIGALFFQKVFGDSWTAKLLPVMVMFSSLGNVIASAIGKARIIREIARQGLLPWPEFFASTKPFGTPLGPLLMKYVLTIFVILVIPAGDAFSFLLDLFSYPHLFFSAATTFGVWILRRRFIATGSPKASSKYRASNTSVILYLASCIFLIVTPWIPPEKGHADVSFWYATYCVAGILILLACGVYYYVWIALLPRLGGYEVVEEIEELEGGARLARLVRKYPNNSSRQASLGSDQRNLAGDDFDISNGNGSDGNKLKRQSREEREPLL